MLLDHVGVQVADVDASVAFYLRTFGVLGLWEAVRHPVGASHAVGIAGEDGFPHFWLGPALGAETGHWAFCTNGSGTAALGIATIGFGPGDETFAHRVDEHIELAELQAGARDYAALVEALTA